MSQYFDWYIRGETNLTYISVYVILMTYGRTLRLPDNVDCLHGSVLFRFILTKYYNDYVCLFKSTGIRRRLVANHSEKITETMTFLMTWLNILCLFDTVLQMEESFTVGTTSQIASTYLLYLSSK